MQCLRRIITAPRYGFPTPGSRCDNHPVGAGPQGRKDPAQRRNIAMKSLLACTGLLLVTATVFAQQGGPPKSPAETASATIGGKAISITYSSPRVNGREGKLFGKDGQLGKDPTYPVWRAGANNATKLHVDGDIRIGDVAVPKGDYTLYDDVADPDNWTLVVNKQTGQWGTKVRQGTGPGAHADDHVEAVIHARRPDLYAG